MCGISGFFSAPPLTLQERNEVPLAMRDALRHRGPDGSGIRIFEHAALVHNRLSIIDLESGQQPMLSPAGDIAIVFNGEIYNYRELRARLDRYAYRTHSDTEVILAIYQEQGVEGFRDLRGMYAMAIWDERIKTGWLVRDPVGIKPLFYSMDADQLHFGSEAKAILAATPADRRRLDTNALHHLMNFRYVVDEDSLFGGIRQLQPGQVVRWRAGEVTHLSLAATESFACELPDACRDAVERHLVADVPIGCYLSGGVDSAIVARLAFSKGPLSTYTLNVGDDPDECRNAAATAQFLGLDNRVAPFEMEDPIGFHRSLVRHMEAPAVNALQSAVLAEFAARHVKVALSGLGGDELFFGYNAHRLLFLAQQVARLTPFKLNGPLGRFLQKQTPAVPVWSEPFRAAAMLEAVPDWSRLYGILRNVWDSPDMRRRIYGERMLDARPADSFEWLAGAFPTAADPLEAMRTFEFRHKMVNDLLWHEDRVSMRVGLEVRVPFLDLDFANYALRQRRGDLMPFGMPKHALKKFARTVLPASIVKRPKSGFQLQIADAMGRQLGSFIAEYLSAERVAHHRLFNIQFVRDTLRNAGEKNRRWHYFLLYLMAQTHVFVEDFDVA